MSFPHKGWSNAAADSAQGNGQGSAPSWTRKALVASEPICSSAKACDVQERVSSQSLATQALLFGVQDGRRWPDVVPKQQATPKGLALCPVVL